MINTIYRFLLQLGDGGDKIPVNPLYKNDLSLDWELETEQRFYRKKLSDKITFLRDDYEIINNAPFGTTFYLYLEASNNLGQSFAEIARVMFHKTDCTINDDDKNISVQTDVADAYNDVLAGMEKEYNLMDLPVQRQYLTITKRPLIQIYTPGDSIVSCFIGGSYWEQDATSIDDEEDLVNTYYFALCNIIKEIVITADGTPAEIAGTYRGRMSINTDGNAFTGYLYSANPDYYIYVEHKLLNGIARGAVSVEIIRRSDNAILFIYQRLSNGIFNNEQFTLNANPLTDATGDMQADMTSRNIYARYLCDVKKINDTDTYTIPLDDIVENNRNYQRVIRYAVPIAYLSDRLSDDATKWGLADNGQYFLPPYDMLNRTYYPIAQSTWGTTSIWFAFYDTDWILEGKASKKYTFRESYVLASCINVLLAQFAPGITHEATPEYSQFLYGATNPISGEPLFKLLITQKSNILNGEYQTPAQKAPTTLKQITDMLKNVYKCYWYIEKGMFKIEHIEFFRNGGSYANNPVIGTDLTTLINIRNGKTWAFATSEYSFEKVDMAGRYQFAWMDDVTTIFEGLPIEVKSTYITAGKVEDINVSNYTTDVDMLLLNPGDMSNDGFALFAAREPDGGGQLELPIINITVGNTEYRAQNGLLAFAYIQPKYWLYDMPAKNLTVNETDVYADSIERNKKQTINFPTDLDINPVELVKTYIGDGEIEKISLNLSSLTAKITLRYDTE